MKTEDLIDLLARDVPPAERPQWRRRLALTLLVGFAIALILTALSIGLRPDIGVALGPVLLKAGFSALGAAVALPLAARLMRPGRALGWRVAAVLIFFGVCALAAAIALIGMAPEKRLAMWLGGGFPWCLVLIPIFATPTAIGLVWLVRGLAPTRLTLSGAAIGAVSGSIGALAYSMHCPIDSVPFVATWYAAAIALCAAIGAVLGSRLLRW
ncbi:MAG TPA: DUF1109 domain-containing protein [Caulobacterales bacterium]|nr:DUF1109 domain-containing protein [Caulobacterales bacterium]